MKCELNVKTYKNKENLTKKQGKINKKARSMGKMDLAKRREMMGNTWGNRAVRTKRKNVREWRNF